MNMQITNAAPLSRNLGIEDLSTRTLTPQPEVRPAHMPKVYGFAQKGDHTKAYAVDSVARNSIFGADSFDEQKKWFNHATVFSNGFARQGNTQMFQRVKPADAPGPATIRLMLDLLPTMVQDYERNSDGSYRRASDGALIPLASKTAGYLAKWVVTQVAIEDGEDTFGVAEIGPGDQTDADNNTQSQRYPIMDVRVSSFGSWGNNQAIRIWAPTVNSSVPLDRRLLTAQGVYPFFISCAARADSLSTAKIVPTLGGSSQLAGSNQIPFVFKKGVVDRNTNRRLYLEDVFVPAYQDISTPGMPPQFGPFGDLKVYDANVATVLTMVHAAELAIGGAHNEFDGVPEEHYMFNFISGTTSAGAPYHSYKVVTGAANSVRLTETNNIFAQGGGDGTMNNQTFADLVEAELLQYADENSPVQDSATNPESIFYDSGFPMNVKKAAASFISIRKDTSVVASVFESGGPVLTTEEELSIATALLTHYQMYSESEFFGTPTARACIVGSSGYLLNSNYMHRVPASYEIAVKSADYMGASNGKWTAGLGFDSGDRAQIDHLRDLSLPFRSANARNKSWEAGMIWPQAYSRSRFYFPQLQTVYPDDTSVLNGFFTMQACVELQKIGEGVHRDFSGVSNLTPDQLVDRINSTILERVKDKFDGRYEIEPQTTFTADDKLRGYSWTTTIVIRSPMMQTVQTLIIQSQRREDN